MDMTTKVPVPLLGPTQERQPTPEEMELIQWIFDIPECGYGGLTQQKVREIQSAHGLPVDPQVAIGPRTWSLIMQAYWTKVSAQYEWAVPASPLALTGDSPQSRYLAAQIQRLNQEKIPRAARNYVRNKRIQEQKPTEQVAAPDVTDPEVQQVIAHLTWDQTKINLVWLAGRNLGVDPRLLLAVLIQEGTGSFNTNSQVRTQWWNEKRHAYDPGGSGPEPDFQKDLNRAMEQHILAKIRAYGYYAAAFQQACRAAEVGDGNLFQYVNYNVPAFKGVSWSPAAGCYATHTEWWRGLQSAFDNLVAPGATQAYSQYLSRKPIAVPAPGPLVSFVRTTTGTGPTEAEKGQPWIEARLATGTVPTPAVPQQPSTPVQQPSTPAPAPQPVQSGTAVPAPNWQQVAAPSEKPWKPWAAPIQSTTTNRSKALLEAVIKQCKVATAPRYQPNQQGKGETYCNIFLWDVTRALGAEIPHWVKIADMATPSLPDYAYKEATETNANRVCEWLEKYGASYGWTKTDAAGALAAANAGKPAVAVWKNPSGIGHVAVLRPGTADPVKGVPTAQAGATNFDDRYLTDGFGSGKAIVYYTHA